MTHAVKTQSVCPSSMKHGVVSGCMIQRPPKVFGDQKSFGSSMVLLARKPHVGEKLRCPQTRGVLLLAHAVHEEFLPTLRCHHVTGNPQGGEDALPDSQSLA